MAEIFLHSDLIQSDDLTNGAWVESLHMVSVNCGEEALLRQVAALASAPGSRPVSTGALFRHPDPQCGQSLSPQEFLALLQLQLIRFTSVADLNHVKLDDALFQLVETDEVLRTTFLTFVRTQCLISILCPVHSELEKRAQAMGLPTIPEVYVDQHYSAEGTRVSDSVVDPTLALTRLQQVHQYHEFTAEEGTDITLSEDYSALCATVAGLENAGVVGDLRAYLDAQDT